MTRDDIIRMAREAGATTPRSIWPPTLTMYVDFSVEAVERFAALVAAAEREECAETCYNIQKWIDTSASNVELRNPAQACAIAIRARQ